MSIHRRALRLEGNLFGGDDEEMGGHETDRSLRTVIPSDALRCAYHLSCIAGPDLGSVIPLIDGEVIGRQTMPWLIDPNLSRLAFVIRTDSAHPRHIGTLESITGRHRSRAPLSRKIVLHRTLRLGSSRWKVRRRPGSLEWELPAGKKAATSRLRFLPLLFVLWLGWRVVPGGWLIRAAVLTAMALGLFLALALFSLRKRRRNDAAFLSLCFWAGAPRSPGEPVGARVWVGAVGKSAVRVLPGEALAVVGPNCEAGARWIAAQLSLALPHLRLDWTGEETGPGDSEYLVVSEPTRVMTGPSSQSILITWGRSPEELPGGVRTIIPSIAPVGSNWLAAGPALSSDSNQEADLPTSVQLSELVSDLSAAAIESRWEGFMYNWAVPVAQAPEGAIFEVDLLAMGPHALLAGATGSGKTVALRTWLWSLTAHIPPTSLRLVLIDYKGGAGMQEFGSCPHVDVLSSDLDPSGTAWVLRRLAVLLKDRKVQLLQAGFTDLASWERASTFGETKVAPPARLLVVVDEFQVLYEEHPRLMGVLTRLAAQGRSLGLHLILATQRPGQAVNADLRGTVDLRVGLRFTEPVDSLAVLGTTAGAELPAIPGRAIVLGETIQFAHTPPLQLPLGWEQQETWPTPLPVSLSAHELAGGGVLGLRDSKDGAHRPESVSPPAGASLLVGVNQAELRASAHWFGLSCAAGGKLYRLGADGQSDEGITARALTQILRGDRATLVVEDLTDLLRGFEFMNLSLEFMQLWQRLIQKASRGDLNLICVDTEGTPAARSFRQIFARVSRPSDWQHPPILRSVAQLPRAGASLAEPGTLTEEEATSAEPGRFLVNGVAGPEPFLLQLPTRDLPEAMFAPLPALPWPEHVSTDRGILCGHQFDSDQSGASRITAYGVPREAVAFLESLGIEVSPVAATNALAPLLADGAWLAVCPSPELLRALATRFPEDALWLRASYPYPDLCGVLVMDGAVLPASIPDLNQAGVRTWENQAQQPKP